MTSPDLSNVSIAFLATEGVERVELTGPWDAAKECGATVHLISTDQKVQSFDHLDKADLFTADRTLAEASPDGYDALVLPGGVANPDALRMDDDAVSFVSSFMENGKVVAAICHAPWLLAEADAVRGRRLTSWPSLQTDLRNAGAEWTDEEVVIDTSGPGPLITSRNPGDVPAFTDALLDAVAPAA